MLRVEQRPREGLCRETLQGGYPGQTQSSFININSDALGSSEKLGGEGLFLQGHFKLSILQWGGDTGSAPRELWLRVNRKWSEEMNQSYKTPLGDFLLLSPPTLIFAAQSQHLDYFLWPSISLLTGILDN